METKNLLEFRVSLDDKLLEPGEHRRLISQLNERLRRLAPLSIELEQGAVVDAKVKGFAEAGALAIQILPGLLPKLVEAVAAWVGPRKERTVTLRLVSGERQVEVTFAPESLSPKKIQEYIRSIDKAYEVGGPDRSSV